MDVSLSSRGLRGAAGGILAGIIAAVMLRYVLAPPSTFVGAFIQSSVACLVALPLFVAGLGAGVVSSAAAAAVSVLGVCVSDPSTAFGYAILCAIPAVAITAFALRQRTGVDGKPIWYSEGNLVAVTVLYACAVFVIAVAAASGHPGGLLALTIQSINDSIASMIQQVKETGMLDAVDLSQMTASVPATAKYLPSFLGSGWILFVLISLFVAQAALKRRNWNLRPGFAIRDMAVPNWLVFAVAATGLVGVFAPAPFDYAGVNVAIMLSLPFFFVGLAIVHSAAAATKARVWLLTIYYLLISLPWTMLPVFVLTLFAGILDQWFNFRRRMPAWRGG